MKKTMLATAAVLLLGPSIAFAQDQGDRHGHDRQPPAAAPAAPAPRAQPAPQPRAASQPGARPDWNAYMRNNPDLQKDYAHNQTTRGYTETPQAYAERHYREHGQAEGRAVPQTTGQAQQAQGQSWNGANRGQGRDAGQGERNWNGDRNRPGDNAGRGDRGRQEWRADTRFRNYERNYSAQRHFRFGRYERPRGWYARRWTFGEFLPSLFWTQNYWISDFSAFDLPYPPPGCTWVRYGGDALLIDRYTGEIIQVVYNIFY